jgi:hypothetical protein
MASLIVRSSGPTAQIIELNPGVNRIGRGSGNDHILEDALVSQWHCEILLEGGFILVRDLGSTNGTFIEGRRITEATLYPGQVLRLGPLELVLDAPPMRLAIPELPKPEAPPVGSAQLSDGHAACMQHSSRHAVWECPHCARSYCHDCIRKLRRVGGRELRLCPGCGNQVELSAWGKLLQSKDKSFFGKLAGRIREGLKRTSRMFNAKKIPARPKRKSKTRKD